MQTRQARGNTAYPVAELQTAPAKYTRQNNNNNTDKHRHNTSSNSICTTTGLIINQLCAYLVQQKVQSQTSIKIIQHLFRGCRPGKQEAPQPILLPSHRPPLQDKQDKTTTTTQTNTDTTKTVTVLVLQQA